MIDQKLSEAVGLLYECRDMLALYDGRHAELYKKVWEWCRANRNAAVTTTLTSKESHVASDRETVRRLSGDLALARNCLSNLLFAESALDKELARREARRFLGHPPIEPAPETGVVYRKWPGEPPHCMSCSCGMTDEQKRMVPEEDYLRIHRELMDLKYPGGRPALKAKVGQEEFPSTGPVGNTSPVDTATGGKPVGGDDM